MSLLSYEELINLVDTGVIENSCHEHVNATSIDLTLGDVIYLERPVFGGGVVAVDMLTKDSNHLFKVTMDEEGYEIQPGAVVLAQTREVFNLPNWISAEYKLKSTQARNFFDHLNAGWCDAGWHGSVLTLEFVNHNQHHSVRIKPGIKCGQIVFFQHAEVPEDKSYKVRGQYNNDKETTTGKGLR